MTPMIDTAAYDRLREENTRLTEKLTTIERAAYIVYDCVLYDLDTLRPLILEHLGPVVRGARGAEEIEGQTVPASGRLVYQTAFAGGANNTAPVPASSRVPTPGAVTEEIVDQIIFHLGTWLCAECPRAFTAAEVATEKPGEWGHSCSVAGAERCESFRTELTLDEQQASVVAAAILALVAQHESETVAGLRLDVARLERENVAFRENHERWRIDDILHEREECCAQLCERCAEKAELQRHPQFGWRHWDRENEAWYKCGADRIREAAHPHHEWASGVVDPRSRMTLDARLALDDETIVNLTRQHEADDALRAENEGLSNEAADWRGRTEEAESREHELALSNDGIRADVARLTGERDRADAALEAREAVMSTQRTRIADLRQENARLRNENAELRGPLTTKIRAADGVMKAIDAAVQGGHLGSRTPIADARAGYGNPHEYTDDALRAQLADAEDENRHLYALSADNTARSAAAITDLEQKLADADKQWTEHRDLCLEAAARHQRERHDIEAQLAAVQQERDRTNAVCVTAVKENIDLRGQLEQATAREAILREEYRRLEALVAAMEAQRLTAAASNASYRAAVERLFAEKDDRLERAKRLVCGQWPTPLPVGAPLRLLTIADELDAALALPPSPPETPDA